MTQLECFWATVNHEKPGRTLYHFGCTPDLAKRWQEYVKTSKIVFGPGNFEPANTGLKRPEDYPLPDFSKYFEDEARPDGSFIDGNGCLHVPGSRYHFTHRVSPLRNAAAFKDIQSYPWPDYTRYESAHIKQVVKTAHEEGKAARVSCSHMYEDAWQVRGYEPFLIDIISEPEWAHFVLDRFMERNKLTAVAAAEAGADILATGDDVANQNSLMFSIDHWREFIKAKWAIVYAAARAIKPDIQIWYHSDGNITDIIP